MKGSGFCSRVSNHRDSGKGENISALWNSFTFLDEQLLVAVVDDGVGAVVGGHHAVVGLRAGASVANWETNNKYF